MEVDRSSFNWELPGIFRAISEAHFVSVDLEFSGIPSRKALRPRQDGQSGSRQTLQQRYVEVKEAAEMYNVLQVGLTCVKEDLENERYIFRSYNFFSNPILKEKLDLDRNFTFSSEAMGFLLGWGFSMDRLLRDGVPYLSRVEEARLRHAEAVRRNKAQEELPVAHEDSESTHFLDSVRLRIDIWKRLAHTDKGFLNISGTESDRQTGVRGLNSFQKRLVHQLVRAEHPDLVTFSPKPDFIQVKFYNKEREDATTKSKHDLFERKIHLQTGLRWLFEAMAGGDLSRVDVASFAKVDSSASQWIDLGMEIEKFRVLRNKLKDKRTVLVGHNMFMDLVYLYHTYFGNLPDTVEEFVKLIHETFPLIVDTKFLAAREDDAANAMSGLEELDKHFTQQSVPQIEMMTGHDKYFYSDAHHEAAYDSLMTAKVLIRMSAFLEADGDYINVSNDILEILANDPDALGESLMAKRSEEARTRHKTNFSATPETIPQQTTKAQGKRSNKKCTLKGRQSSRFSTVGMFDALLDIPTQRPEERTVTVTTPANDLTDWGLLVEPDRPAPMPVNKKALSRLMPAWKKDFWRVYGNKVRVNGTIEGICDFGPRNPAIGNT